jgi:hypothetical protein
MLEGETLLGIGEEARHTARKSCSVNGYQLRVPRQNMTKTDREAHHPSASVVVGLNILRQSAMVNEVRRLTVERTGRVFKSQHDR